VRKPTNLKFLKF